jgi:magnesium and cobalt transporter
VKTLVNRFCKVFSKKTKSPEDFLSILRQARQANLINPELLSMIEGVLQIASMHASDVMVPKPDMIFIRDNSAYTEILAEINESAHSRYPVIRHENPDEVLGILLAKDLLPFTSPDKQNTFDVKTILRDVLIVPETKRLDALLREFRLMHNHLAIVVDEYGSIVGLVTIEDILEEIVGEIEDEYDVDDGAQAIEPLKTGEYQVNAQLSLEEFNQYFHTEFSSEQFNTIGGVVMHAFGYLPESNEEIKIQGSKFKILKADNRRIYSLLYWPLSA